MLKPHSPFAAQGFSGFCRDPWHSKPSRGDGTSKTLFGVSPQPPRARADALLPQLLTTPPRALRSCDTEIRHHMLHTPPRSDWYIMCFFSTYKSYTALLIGLGCFVWAAFLFVWGFGLRFLVGVFLVVCGTFCWLGFLIPHSLFAPRLDKV